MIIGICSGFEIEDVNGVVYLLIFFKMNINVLVLVLEFKKSYWIKYFEYFVYCILLVRIKFYLKYYNL